MSQSASPLVTPSSTVTLDQILSGFDVIVDARLVPESMSITGITLNSRDIKPGAAYVALQGTQAHGLDYVGDAEARGASVVFVDAATTHDLSSVPLPVVRIHDLSQSAGALASAFHNDPSRHLNVCGVTGTDGKTSVAQFIAQALNSMGIPTGYIGTIGWGVGDSLSPNPLTTPDAMTLQSMMASMLASGVTHVVLEVSSHALVQGRVNGVVFDVAVLTNLGRDHLDYHGTIEDYAQAKQKLFVWPGLRGAVLNHNDAFGQTLSSVINPEVPLIRYSGQSVSSGEDSALKDFGQEDSGQDNSGTGLGGHSSQANLSLSVSDVTYTDEGMRFVLHDAGQRWVVNTGLIGQFNIDNLLATYGALRTFGVGPADAAIALDKVKAVPGRMERFAAQGRATVVVDYSHTPQALQAAISSLRTHCSGELWVVFGCGGDRDPGKRPLMGDIAGTLADHVVVTDDNPRTESSDDIIRDILAGMDAGQQPTVIADRGDAIRHALRSAVAGDWVLVAGKGHEDYQIVGAERLSFSDREVVCRTYGIDTPSAEGVGS